MKIFKFFALSVLLTGSLFAQESARIMTYNILNYPGDDATERNPDFELVIDAIEPDILVVNEITSNYGVQLFKSEVLGNDYTAGFFNDGPDTDNAIFYKDSLFTLLYSFYISTELRNIAWYTLTHNITNDTLAIFAVHLKASPGGTNEQRRLEEVQELRQRTDNLHPDYNFLVLGDFNIYTSNEPAFQELLDQSSTGYVLDPISSFGSWHNNSSFANIHTQSTRDNNPGGGSGGGLDDRFDMILVSQGVWDDGGVEYNIGSYRTFGNDGNHFNKAINLPPYDIISQEMANALHDATDHLPVYADFYFKGTTTVDDKNLTNLDFKLNQNYPNPFNPSTNISFTLPESGFATLSVYNILGQKVETLFKGMASKGTTELKFDASGLPGGVYFYRLETEGFTSTKKLTLLK